MASLPGADELSSPTTTPCPHSTCTARCSSLPLAFGTTLDTIPATIPYRRGGSPADGGVAQAAGGAAWAEGGAGLACEFEPGPWRSAGAGSPAVDPLARLAPLGGIPRVSLVSLQKGAAATQAREPPVGLTVHDWTDELADFADTAALVAGLDLVISVDTAVAHRPGALGTPVWVLKLAPTPAGAGCAIAGDSPWYPTARLFRQPTHGDWDPVIAEVAAAPGAFAAPPPRQRRRTKVQYSGARPARSAFAS